MRMVVGLDYTQYGDRVVSEIFSAPRIDSALLTFESAHDEVYIVDINQNHKEFINTIVKDGKRFA